MTTDIETRTGQCATHGRVVGTREMPRMGFPFMVYAARRFKARRAPFVCPHCGAPVRGAGRRGR